MALTEELLKKVKEEILTDPNKVGYAECKNNAEIAAKLNNGYTTKMEVSVQHAPPITNILQGIANVPNVISELEVTQAKTLV